VIRFASTVRSAFLHTLYILIQRRNLFALVAVNVLLERGEYQRICSLPCLGLMRHVREVLLTKALAQDIVATALNDDVTYYEVALCALFFVHSALMLLFRSALIRSVSCLSGLILIRHFKRKFPCCSPRHDHTWPKSE
jgi:hypothetical protein